MPVHNGNPVAIWVNMLRYERAYDFTPVYEGRIQHFSQVDMIHGKARLPVVESSEIENTRDRQSETLDVS